MQAINKEMPHLPIEILDLIISFIPDPLIIQDLDNTVNDQIWHSHQARGWLRPSTDIRTLQNLCLVNKVVRRLAERYLYAQYAPYLGRSSAQPGKLRQLVVHILRRPELAGYIRFVSVGLIKCEPKLCSSSGVWVAMKPETEKILLNAVDQCGGLRFNDFSRESLPGDSVEQHIIRGCPAALILLLLGYAPNLEILEVGPQDERDLTTRIRNNNAIDDSHANFDPMICRLNMMSGDKPGFSPPLSKLKTLVLNKHGLRRLGWIDLDQWRPILQLPSLRTLYTCKSRSTTLPIKPMSLSITKVSLKYSSDLHSMDIHRILRSCKALQQVTISHDPLYLIGDEWHPQGWNDWYTTTYEGVEYLDHCTSSLEVLEWPLELQSRRMLIDLAAFRNLWKVSVSICALYNDVIPPSDGQPCWEDKPSEIRGGDLLPCFPGSIRHITFYGCNQQIHEHHQFEVDHGKDREKSALATFADVASIRLKKLEHVAVVSLQHVLDEHYKAMIEERFGLYGVRFTEENGDLLPAPPNYAPA